MRRWFRFPGRMKRSTRSNAVRWRGESARAALLIVVAWASFGCDSFSFVPPQPEELRGAARCDAGWRRRPGRSSSCWARTGPTRPKSGNRRLERRQGLTRSSSRSSARRSPRSTQAELVREALAHDPRVLVIESTGLDDPPLLQAIEQARSQGIPVVLVGRPPAGAKAAAGAPGEPKTTSTASSGHQAPLVSVVPQPFSISAKQLVAAAIRNAHYSGLEPGKSAIIVVNTTGDPFVPERALAIKDALKAAGITTITEARFADEASERRKSLERKPQGPPRDRPGLHGRLDRVRSALRGVLKNDTAHRFFVVGCYSGEGQAADLTTIVQVAAVAEFTPTRLMRKAIATAAALAQGRDVPPLVEFPINVSDAPATPAAVKAQALQWKKDGEAAEKAKK